MDDFEKYLAEQLENPEFKQEWDSHELEYQLTVNLMKERTKGIHTNISCP